MNSKEKGLRDMRNVPTAALALAGAVLLAGGVQTTNAQATKDSLKCASSKLKTIGKDYAAKLKCYGKAVTKGVAVDPLCLSKAEGKTMTSFQKAIDKGGCASDANFFDQNESCPPAPGLGDGIPDGQIGSILNVINCGYPTVSGISTLVTQSIPPPPTVSKCASKKVGALGKFASALFGCASKGASKNVPTDQACLDKATANLNKAFDKEDTKVGNDCFATGDALSLSGQVNTAFQKLVPLAPRSDGCGNGLVTTTAPFAIENCDDGNTNNFDSCPSDCFIDPCTPTANPRPVTVVVSDPNIGATLIEIDYPEGKVNLPGLGFEADVTPLIAGVVSPLDFEHAIRLGATDSPNFGQTQVATLNFVDCQGATPPVVGEFTCSLRDTADGGGVALPSATCSVTIP